MSNADVLIPAIFTLVGVVVGVVATAWRIGSSEYYADVRHLRDLQASRVRAAFKPLLAVARVLSDVTRELNHALQPADTTARDKWVNDAITEAMTEYTTARIALQLEPRIAEQIDPLFADMQRAYQMFRSSFEMREELRQKRMDDDPSLSAGRINELAEKVIETTEVLNAEMRALLKRLDEPAKPRYVRDRLRT